VSGFNSGIRTLLIEAASAWGPRPVVVAAGRNFSIEDELYERTIIGAGLISWGSTLFEYVYGRHLAGNQVPLRIMPSYRDRLSFLQQPQYAVEAAAMLLLAPHIQKAFHDESAEIALASQWEELLKRTKAYVMDRPLRLDEVWTGDAWPKSPSLYSKTPAYVYIPQQIVPAAEEVFFSDSWTGAVGHELFEEKAMRAVSSASPFFLVSTTELPHMPEEHLKGRLISGKNNLWVYSSHGTPLVLRTEGFRRLDYEAFEPMDGEWDVAIVEARRSVYSHVRAMLRDGASTIERVPAGACFLLTINGKVVCGWTISFRLHSGMNYFGMVTATVIDEFVVRGNGMAELLRSAIFSREARLMYESSYSSRVEVIQRNGSILVYGGGAEIGNLEVSVEDWRVRHSSDAGGIKYLGGTAG